MGPFVRLNDSLAAPGTVFDRFYVASAVGMPNRVTLATGYMLALRLPASDAIGLKQHALSRRFSRDRRAHYLDPIAPDCE